MIKSIGGTVRVDHTSVCCMVCNPSAFSDGVKLSVLQIGKAPPRKKRRVAIRKLNQSTIKALRSGLKAERAKVIAEDPTLAILGEQLVCPEGVIDSICSDVKFISVVTDMDSFCLRQELKQRFFNVIMAVVNSCH